MNTVYYPQLEPGLNPDQGRVRLRTLVLIRWLALGGQTAALLTVHFGLELPLPLVPALLVVLASGTLNIVQMISRPASSWLRNREATVALAFDLLQVAVLLALTGGLTNPFSVLILAPVTVSASILARRSTILLCILAILSVSAMSFFYYPLPWPEGSFFLNPLYLYGLWAALVFTTIFLAIYVSSLTEEARSMGSALFATQMALSREQRLSALGGLAAAAAHELGSPLGTMLMVAKEMKEDLPSDDPLMGDVDLIISEVQRCRDILQNLATWPQEDGGDPYNFLPIESLVEAAVEPYEKPEVYTDIAAGPKEGSDAVYPLVRRSPELLHSLGLLVQNAIQFAEDQVDIDVSWDDRLISLSIRDNGPGFDAQVLNRLGDPFLSSREQGGREQGERLPDSDKTKDPRKEEDGEHMGLGVFIATTLLSHTGARVHFSNHPEGGALIEITWPRHRLEAVTQ